MHAGSAGSACGDAEIQRYTIGTDTLRSLATSLASSFLADSLDIYLHQLARCRTSDGNVYGITIGARLQTRQA